MQPFPIARVEILSFLQPISWNPGIFGFQGTFKGFLVQFGPSVDGPPYKFQLSPRRCRGGAELEGEASNGSFQKWSRDGILYFLLLFFPHFQENLLPFMSFQASSPAYSGSNIYSPDSSTNSGPIISDVTELAQSSPSASPSGSLDER